MTGKDTLHTEGELYRVINVCGAEFALYYGYYEEQDRENPLVDPMPIYPDLLSEPRYTQDGKRIVTRMQDACDNYDGARDGDEVCGECRHFKRCESLFGVCQAENN